MSLGLLQAWGTALIWKLCQMDGQKSSKNCNFNAIPKINIIKQRKVYNRSGNFECSGYRIWKSWIRLRLLDSQIVSQWNDSFRTELIPNQWESS